MKVRNTTRHCFNRLYNVIKKTCKLFLVSTVAIIIFAVLVQILYIDNKGRILNEFSNNLFQYPLPSDTVIIEARAFDGKNFLGGNGGYWCVGTTMKLSTKLTREEVLNYYKYTKFPFPKNNDLSIEPEIYFEGEYVKKEYYKSYAYKDGFYYVSKKGRQSNMVHNYFDENGVIKNTDKIRETNHQELIYIIQILSDYDYFLNID